ncbi:MULTISPECIES: hypothetical protein [Cryobacterium]|uniref:Cation transporter n=1 Tax=Cryobacterium breve TaxID=1259258 RepID=A0ABY2J973_9MICO|nr:MULTISPECIES: hypothetical protein [Cryobacterium]TFC95745.1 hypothetical protein E3T20_05095 [Cryobacterium sp. TmT3-12]TFD00184.1 hypothetical protein E3O65_03390 [Cryobacterium breve]
MAGAKRRAGVELGIACEIADARQLLLCAWLSGAMRLVLAANALLGWAWADSVAALVVAGVAIREGAEAWSGEAGPTNSTVIISCASL